VLYILERILVIAPVVPVEEALEEAREHTGEPAVRAVRVPSQIPEYVTFADLDDIIIM